MGLAVLAGVTTSERGFSGSFKVTSVPCGSGRGVDSGAVPRSPDDRPLPWRRHAVPLGIRAEPVLEIAPSFPVTEVSTALELPRGRASRRRDLPGVVSPAVVLVVVVLALEGLMTSVGQPFLALALPGVLLPALIALRAPRRVAFWTLALALPLLGVIRRITGSYLAGIDPLTLLPPLVAVTCIVALVGSGARRPRTSLGGAVGVMALIGIAGILNPLQGGPLVGVAGAGLFVGPLIWFYVGQLLGTDAFLAKLQRCLRIVAILVVAYGTKQLLVGFFPFEQRWISAREADYQALYIGGRIRPFSIFASGAEYSYFLVLGAILCFLWKRPVGRPFRWPLVAGMLVATFYAGSRSIFVTGVAAAVVVALLLRGWRLARALLVCVLLAALGLALLRLIPETEGDSTAAKIRNRTLSGLSDPFNPDVSTLGIHLEAVRNGIVEGLENPLGQGGAVVNSAGKRFGTGTRSADHDLPNLLIAYGWAGGVMFFVLFVRIYRLVDKAASTRRPELIGSAVFAFALCGVWFLGELYAVSALVWFFLGALDRQLAAPSDEALETPSHAVSERLALAGAE